VLTLTSELLKSWKIPNLIPDELLPMGVMDVFEAPISPGAKIRLLLHEEVLGRRGLVYVAAKAARRACTKTGWNHAGSIQALDLCDRYAAGEEVSKEELERAAKDADVTATDAGAVQAAWAASWTASAMTTLVNAQAAAQAATTWAALAATSSAKERRFQLADCREWLLTNSPQERAPILTRYQRIMRSLS
jgi:hypothetical protein